MHKMLMTMALMAVSYSTFAAECPVQFGREDYAEKVVHAIQAAPSCLAASDLAEACALGSSLDPSLTVVAERKCGLDFWKKLNAEEKKVYNGLQAKCDAKYRNMEGTMYLSFNGFCRLNVARLYSDLYTPAE